MTPDYEELYHTVMKCLRKLQLPHGKCLPREDRACTHCNAQEELNKLIAEYKGRPIRLASDDALIADPEETRCPNCGASHAGADGNSYCPECSRLFKRWGMYNFIDKDGLRNV